MSAYRIEIYDTLSTSENFMLIPHEHIINLSIMEEGNANQDPFEFVGSRAKVSIYNYAVYGSILDMDRNDRLYNKLVRIYDDDSNASIFTGAILIEDISINHLDDTIDFVVSDSLRIWIAKARTISLDGGQYDINELFNMPLAGYGELNQIPLITEFLEPNIVSCQLFTSGFYLPYSNTWMNNPLGGGVNSDLFTSDDDPDDWKVVSRQATIWNSGTKITRFFIIRKFLGSTLLFRVKYQIISMDTSRLVQGIHTVTTGIITVPQTLSYPTAFNYIRSKLIQYNALPNTVTYAQTIVTEYENGEPLIPSGTFNYGEAVNSLVPLFSQTQTWDYASGEQRRVDKYGRIGGLVNISKDNLICSADTLSATIKAFCLILGIGISGKNTGGLRFFRHILREFNTSDVVTVSDTDIIDKKVSGLITNFDNAISALDVFEYSGTNMVKFVMRDYFNELFSDIAMEITLVLPKSYYDNNSFSAFARIEIDERNYYALNWSVPLFDDVFTLRAIGGKRA